MAIGEALIFDRTFIHCASDLKTQNRTNNFFIEILVEEKKI